MMMMTQKTLSSRGRIVSDGSPFQFSPSNATKSPTMMILSVSASISLPKLETAPTLRAM